MRLFQKVKDGGPQSTVDAYVLIEIKNLFSVMLLKFNKGSRTNFHSHAFNAWTWFLKGKMTEEKLNGTKNTYNLSLKPKFTPKDNFHKVIAEKTSWAFTLRGPWCDTWQEFNPITGEYLELTHNRKILRTSQKPF